MPEQIWRNRRGLNYSLRRLLQKYERLDDEISSVNRCRKKASNEMANSLDVGSGVCVWCWWIIGIMVTTVVVCRSTDRGPAWHLHQQHLLYQRADDGRLSRLMNINDRSTMLHSMLSWRIGRCVLAAENSQRDQVACSTSPPHLWKANRTSGRAIAQPCINRTNTNPNGWSASVRNLADRVRRLQGRNHWGSGGPDPPTFWRTPSTFDTTFL